MRGLRSFISGAVGRVLCASVLLCSALLVQSATLVAQNASPLRLPSAIAYDASGNLFIADANRHQVLEATLAGTLTVVAGNGVQGFAGDGGAASGAELDSPGGLAFGSDGTLYIADTGNARIRAVIQGSISTFAGNGVHGFAGDGGPASAASLRSPTALAVDASGALLACDTADHRVRRIAAGVIRTFAGSGTQGFFGDAALASAAELDSPSGLAITTDGRVLIADTHNHRVRSVGLDGIITTSVGNGQRGLGGDGGPAVNAQLSSPRGLAVMANGGLLIADADNQRVRAVNTAGVIATLAGAGREGASTDGAAAVSAALRGPRAVAVSSYGMPVILDALNGTVRVLTAAAQLFQPAALVSGRQSTLQPAVELTSSYGAGLATVTVAGGVASPQGSVSFAEDGYTIASAQLNEGVAQISLASLAAGAHTLTVEYSGDGLNPAAVATTPPLSVVPANVIATADNSTIVFGLSVPALTGSLAGVLPQDEAEVSAVFRAGSIGANAVGTYPITVALAGAKSANYAVSLAPNSGSLRVLPASSTVTLASVGPGYAAMPLPLTANVRSVTSGQPTGSVQFLNGGAVIATAALVNGSASARYVAPGAATLSLSARYGGDSNFTASASAVQAASVSPMPDYTLAVNGSPTASVTAGATATYTLLVSAQPGPFTGDIVLSASGLPPAATVSFTPAQVVPGSGSATVQVNVATPATQAASKRGGSELSSTMAVSFAAACLGLCVLRRRRVLWLLGVAVLNIGCGARTVGESGTPLTPQTYTLQVTGTSTNLLGAVVTHSTPVTLIVGN